MFVWLYIYICILLHVCFKTQESELQGQEAAALCGH